MRSYNLRSVLAMTVMAAAMTGQTTQGLIAGRISDALNGKPLSDARVTYENRALQVSGSTHSDGNGYFALPLLSPGSYRLAVDMLGYQGRAIYALDLTVAARLDINFALRPLSDVWETQRYRTLFLPKDSGVLPFYGPDVDTSHTAYLDLNLGLAGALETSVSQVIERRMFDSLPLAGRDVYQLLVTQPGVSSDVSTSRSIGLSVNGQRPSGSNFLLDGIENNNNLFTGPLVNVPPEFVQEYRISTNNFSAEYGRTSGYVTNAITRSGTGEWHGLTWFHLRNEKLNAGDFQDNAAGMGRAAFKEIEPGGQAGGPILRNRLYALAAFDFDRLHTQGGERSFTLPTTSLVSLLERQYPNGKALSLLKTYPSGVVSISDPNQLMTSVRLRPPNNFINSAGMGRLDAVLRGGRDHAFLRATLGRVRQEPAALYSPFQEFSSPIAQNATSVAAGAVTDIRPGLTNDARAGVTGSYFGDARWHSEVPGIQVATSPALTLPASPVNQEFRARSKQLELSDNLLWTSGAHLWKIGGGVLLRGTSSLLGVLPIGSYGYSGADPLARFEADQVQQITMTTSYLNPRQLTSGIRDYRQRQVSAFAQETWRVARGFSLNFGVRYEYYGAPYFHGSTSDLAVQLGAGSSLPDQLKTAQLLPVAAGAAQYQAGRGDWAVRLGASRQLSNSTVLRAGYGGYYERPYDDMFDSTALNQLVAVHFVPAAGFQPFVTSSAAALQSAATVATNPNALKATYIDPHLRDGRVHSYFLGLQQRAGTRVSFDIFGLGSQGSNLVTTDEINRSGFVLTTGNGAPALVDGRFNVNLPAIKYRANQGLSNYHALSSVARYQSRRVLAQLSYTWSHSIDLQSDPVVGEFTDLSGYALGSGAGSVAQPKFAQQFVPNSNRGNSDFDQRQNLVAYVVFQPQPSQGRLLRNWTLSFLGAARSGLPFTVTAPAGLSLLANRANLGDPAAAMARQPSAGGLMLLARSAFTAPATGQLGNTARNEFSGPGLANLDASICREIALRGLRESARLSIRADAFNLLNHTNLNNPDAFIGSRTFGLALFGRDAGSGAGFPGLRPLDESARQIQILLQLRW